MFSLSDAESSDCNVTVEVGNENSGKAGNDMEQGDCSFWHEDKSGMGKLSCLSVRMWDMTKLGWIKHSGRVTSSFFRYRYHFQLSFPFHN